MVQQRRTSYSLQLDLSCELPEVVVFAAVAGALVFCSASLVSLVWSCV